MVAKSMCMMAKLAPSAQLRLVVAPRLLAMSISEKESEAEPGRDIAQHCWAAHLLDACKYEASLLTSWWVRTRSLNKVLLTSWPDHRKG